MEFPVDLLRDTSHEDLESCAEEYMSELADRDLDQLEYFTQPNNEMVLVSISSVGFVPLYGSDEACKVLALFTSENPLSAVALYLVDQWWAVEDILKTSDNFRNGLIQVKSLGERIVLYVLNRIIYRKQEMSKSESPFLCHSSKEFAKILWEDGQAIGFFSAKTKGSKCESFLTQRYELPILDTVFVRKSYRGRGYGLQLLEDFVDSFADDALGLRYPLPLTMYKVCKQYLEKYPSDHDLLWEVEGVGHLFQRINIARKLQTQALAIKVSEKKQHIEIEDEEPLPNSSGVISERREQNSEIEGMNNVSDVNVMLEENEGNLGLTHILSDVPEDFDTTPISARTRHSNLRRPKLIRTTELHCSALNTEAEIIPETHLETVIRSETDITEEATISVKDQKEDKTQEAAADQIAEESTDEEMSQNKVLHTTDVHNSSWKEETVVHELHKPTINGSVTEETLIQEHTRCNPFNNVPPPQSDELDMEAVAEPMVTEPEASPLQEDLNSAGDTHIIISNHKQEKTEVVDSRETIDDQPLLPNESESDLACSESAGEELSSNDITSAKYLEASSASSFMASNTSASEEDLSFQEVSEAVSDQNKGDLEEDGVHEVSLQKLEEQMHSTPNATKKNLSSTDNTGLVISHKQQKDVAMETTETSDDLLPILDVLDSDLPCPELSGEPLNNSVITSAESLVASSVFTILAPNTSAANEELCFQVLETVYVQNKSELNKDETEDVLIQQLEEKSDQSAEGPEKAADVNQLSPLTEGNVTENTSEGTCVDAPMTKRRPIRRKAETEKAPPRKRRRIP